MSNAWFYYVFPLGISVVLVIAAAVMRRKVIHGDRYATGEYYGVRTSRASKILGGIGGTLGLAILLTSPTPWQRERVFDRVFRTPPERIERFVILPSRANQHQALTRSQVVIDDPARVWRIAEILRTAPEISPNHPRTKWTATVEMVTLDGTCYFGVSATAPGDANGTLVTAQTTANRDGWNLGDVRAEGLDQILEDAVSARRDH